jgi:hypothetical protein
MLLNGKRLNLIILIIGHRSFAMKEEITTTFTFKDLAIVKFTI